MSNDPKQAKTMLGWLPQHAPPTATPTPPNAGAPVPGQAPQQPPYGQAPQHQAYGQPPPQQAHGQPPHHQAYGQPPAPTFGQPPQQQAYGQPPQQQGFGQPPQQQGFGQAPQHQAHGQPYGQAPQPQPYEQTPQPQAYGQAPQPQAYGQAPQPQAYGQAPQPQAYGQAPQSQPYGQAPQSQAYGQAPQQGWGGAPAGQGPAPQPQQGQSQGGSAVGGMVGGMVGGGLAGGLVGGLAGKLGKKKEKKGSKLASEPRAADGSELRGSASATVGVSDRVRFIRLTYLHLLGAILVFAGVEYLLMTNATLVEKVSIPLVKFAIGGRWNWGVVLAAFMAVSWIADYWASHSTSRALQYAGLGFYVIAEALIFVPLLAIVQWKTAMIVAKGGGDPNIIRDAAFTTLAIFGALTVSVLLTKKDFSFMRTGLAIAGAAATMMVVLSLVFGFNLGIVFSVAMVVLAAGYILYQTSQILAHYDPRNYVAASLALFSSVALMFWYVIRIFMRARE